MFFKAHTSFIGMFLVFILSSCSVYKSSVRKDFESRSSGRVDTQASVQNLGQCQELNAVSAWIEKEFPGGVFELLIAEPDLEVWKRKNEQGFVEVRSFLNQPSTKTTLACLRFFHSEQDWKDELPLFFEQLNTLSSINEVTAP